MGNRVCRSFRPFLGVLSCLFEIYDQTFQLPMTSLTKAQEEAIKLVVDYDSMSISQSRTVCQVDSGWATEIYSGPAAGLVVTITKNLTGPHFNVSSDASAFRCRTHASATKPIEQVDAKFFTASAGLDTSATYAGAEVGAHLFKGNVSIFEGKLGAEASTGGGIKDDSLDVKVLGCGVTVGRKVGVQVAGTGFSVDFGKIFS